MIARYKFCLWLVNILSTRRLTLSQLSAAWIMAEANIENTVLSPRTFLRHKALAEEIFNVNIECDKTTNEYWVDLDSLDTADRWTMSALRVQNLMSMTDARQHIILENPPAGQDVLETVANACRDSRSLSFKYKSPYNPAKDYEVIPLFVKLFKQRWYLVCQPVGKDYVSVLALERMENIKTGAHCIPSIDVNAEDYLSDCYGIIRQLEPERIVVRAFWPQNTYLKEVPLHHSQRVVDETDDWTDFSLYLRPTYDFKQDLLWHRDKLAILSPQWLRDDIIDILRRMIESNASGLPHCKDE